MTDDVVYVDLGVNKRMDRRSAVCGFIGAMETMFSPTTAWIQPCLVDGDSSAAEWTMSGTNDGADPQHGLPPPVTGSRSPASRSAECGAARSPRTRTTTTWPVTSCRAGDQCGHRESGPDLELRLRALTGFLCVSRRPVSQMCPRSRTRRRRTYLRRVPACPGSGADRPSWLKGRRTSLLATFRRAACRPRVTGPGDVDRGTPGPPPPSPEGAGDGRDPKAHWNDHTPAVP